MTQRIWHRILFLALAGLFMANTASAEPQAEAQEKVVYHVTDSQAARGALINARNHLDATEGKTRIVFVTHGGGIEFLQQGAADKDGNPYDIAIEKLQGRGVEFRVCNNTLRAQDRSQDPGGGRQGRTFRHCRGDTSASTRGLRLSQAVISQQ